MEIETKYAVKIFFKDPAFLQLYFEAVANAFDAGADEVSIKISTDGQIKPEHLEITISDNGQGFTDERFERFSEVKEPKDEKHKGLGRLVYLRYFSNVFVDSVFGADRRKFKFSNNFKGESEVTNAGDGSKEGAELRFQSFAGERLKSYNDVKPGHIKGQLIAHFLPYFIERKKAGENFKITVELEIVGDNQQEKLFPDTQTITIKDVPTFETDTFHDPNFHAFGEISISYKIWKDSGSLCFNAICVDGRTIQIDLIKPSAIPLGYSVIFLFESDLFSGKSDSSRQRLELPQNISEAALFRALRGKVSTILNDKIPEVEEKNKATKKKFEEKYPHLAGLFEEDTVGIIDSDEAIEMAQKLFFRKQKEVLECESLDDKTYEKSLEVSSRTLTEYILYRELIIKKLGEMGAKDKEEDVHNLIVPRYKKYQNSTLVDGIYNNNAWLLDDKFMSFRTILSEPRMNQLISEITLDEDVAEDNDRPDISMVFSADPDVEDKVDVVVVELKRRAADDKEGPYAATQLIKRAQKLVAHCPNIQRIWYFGVIEIDEALSEILLNMKWTPLFSKGRVYYNDYQVQRSNGPAVPTPIFLLSFDAIIKDAAARNHTFLEILKSDIRRAQEASISKMS